MENHEYTQRDLIVDHSFFTNERKPGPASYNQLAQLVEDIRKGKTSLKDLTIQEAKKIINFLPAGQRRMACKLFGIPIKRGNLPVL